MLELIDPAIEWLKANWLLLAGGLLAAWLSLYLMARIIIVGTARWWLNKRKLHGGTRRPWPIWKPSVILSWFQLQPWYLFQAKVLLLSNMKIRETYAPVGDYLEEREDGKHYIKANWLSPWMTAAWASSKQNRKAARGKHHNARGQVNRAAKHVRTRPLPETIPVAGDRRDHYEVVLHLDGKTRSEIRSLEENIEAAIPKAYSVDYYEAGRTNDSESFIVHHAVPESILTTKMIDSSFFEENPARLWSSFPIAMDEFGKVWSCPITHIIIWGMSGSGKGSPLQAIIRQAIPYVERGEARLFGSDKKETELLPYEFTTLFEDIAYSPEDSMEIINMLHDLMLQRKKEKRAYLNFAEGKANAARRLPATKKTPMMLFFIDEMFSLLLDLHNRGAVGKAAMATLARVLVEGRSLGIYVIAATQNIKQEFMGPMRESFIVAATLRNQATEGMNNVFLGEGAVERGFDPRAIEEATEANNYKTSGIGYVKGETGDPILVRFAYSSDEDIAALVRKHPNEKGRQLLELGELEQVIDTDGEEEETTINDVLDTMDRDEQDDFLKSLEVFAQSDRRENFTIEPIN